MPELHDPFHRALAARLTEEIENRVARLATGSASAIQGEGRTVAEKYAEQVAEITMLQGVLTIAQEVSHEIWGTRPREQGE